MFGQNGRPPPDDMLNYFLQWKSFYSYLNLRLRGIIYKRNEHCFRRWLVEQTTSHCLNQWWQISVTAYGVRVKQLQIQNMLMGACLQTDNRLPLDNLFRWSSSWNSLSAFFAPLARCVYKLLWWALIFFSAVNFIKKAEKVTHLPTFTRIPQGCSRRNGIIDCFAVYGIIIPMEMSRTIGCYLATT